VLALSEPPRPDAALYIAEIRRLGVDVVMVAAAGAATEARDVGVSDSIYPLESIREDQRREDYAVFAGALLEDKFRLVKAFQRARHAVGMWGMAPAPTQRSAQIGVPVATITAAA
jgi:H+-transporting ATPase